MCKKNYQSPKVKAVAFEVEEGYQASQEVIMNVGMSLQQYNKGSYSCSDFFDRNDNGVCGVSTSQYQQDGESFF